MNTISYLRKQVCKKIPDFKILEGEIGVWVNPDMSVDLSSIYFYNSNPKSTIECIQIDKNGNILKKSSIISFENIPPALKKPLMKKSHILKLHNFSNAQQPPELSFMKKDDEWVYTVNKNSTTQKKYKIAIRQECRQVWETYKPQTIHIHYNNKKIEGYYCIYNMLSKKGYKIIEQLFKSV